jgi:hypothetical protein
MYNSTTYKNKSMIVAFSVFTIIKLFIKVNLSTIVAKKAIYLDPGSGLDRQLNLDNSILI